MKNAQCAEKLAEIQQLAGAYFPLPLEFHPEDQRDMEYAQMLLRGEEAQASWSGMMAQPRAETVGNLLAQIEAHGQPFAFATVQEETLVVAGGQLPPAPSPRRGTDYTVRSANRYVLRIWIICISVPARRWPSLVR